ncbi:MAG: 2-amino-3,7-dideoxy-D-threo-hept-6-ulosonate synthase [Candidatus Nitrosocaldaceae archaeon]
MGRLILYVMVNGKDIRMSRILKNGKMLCIPMDHGISSGPIKGIDNIHHIIYSCETQGLTSILINKGIMKSLPKPPRIGTIIHVSGSTSLGPDPNKKVLMGSVEEAIRLGADGVSVHINIGSKTEPEMLVKLGIVADECDKWNIPYIAMMYPRGENIKNPHEPEIVAHVARIGAEAGADIVKTVYTGDPDTFKQVVRSCPVPIVIAGGPKAENDLAILEMVEGAMEAGAIGVTFGRNIFQHNNPPSMVKALKRVIFDKFEPKEALNEIEG